jgi:hypothetical protein
MFDVFGDEAGDIPAGPGEHAVDPAGFEPVLDGARWWGAELDTQYRVLALTFEPTPDRYPWGEAADRRIQVLCHPVSTILASLRREADGERALLEFGDEQLVDVVAALDGPVVTGPLFGGGEPRPGEWGPRFSMQGRSTAGDGTATTLRTEVAHEDLHLAIFARFDHAEAKDATGAWLATPQ